MSRYVSNHLRLAVITDVDHGSGIVYTDWLDQDSSPGPEVPVPHPFAGRGGEGIFVAPRVGQILALGMAAYERYIPVATLPMRAYYGDISGTSEVQFDDVGFPLVNDGEVIIQGKTGAQLCFAENGDIITRNSFGEGRILCGEDDNGTRCAITIDTPVEYTVSQSGLSARGIVRRDIRIEDGEAEFTDFLSNPDSEQALEEIGWDPSKAVTYISRSPTASGSGKTQDKALRNPAFVEDRSVVLEYGREWAVGIHEVELARSQSDIIVSREPEDRNERRSNVLGLSLTSPNELIETVSGTLIDIFGNMIDINRDVIPLPTGKKEVLLNDTLEKARHTIAYHMEINTRKGWGYRDGSGKKAQPLKAPPDPLVVANNARDRGRWFIDVDKEGLTKINIPASSETGNVPLLTRYENSSTIIVDSDGKVQNKARKSEDAKKLFRNSNNKDILLEQFGPGGVVVNGITTENRVKGKKTSWEDFANKQRTFSKTIQAGTAFHDITTTASALLLESINKKASDIFEDTDASPDLPAVSAEIDPNVPKADTSAAVRDSTTGLVDDQPNAGGRSLNINLDGSLEMSVGANTIDRVSWTLDTAGAIVARLGRDRQGRSAIIHADGTVAVEVGGFDFVGDSPSDEVDTRFVGRGEGRATTLPGDPRRFRDGRVVLRIRRANTAGTDADIDDHLVIIDETGITIEAAGRLNMRSLGDMYIQSDSRIVLDSPKVQIYKDNPKFARRDGRTF
jgi:hypothetical protein